VCGQKMSRFEGGEPIFFEDIGYSMAWHLVLRVAVDAVSWQDWCVVVGGSNHV
jgi:hypothetical protein